jgi:hypothetical protein
MGADADFWMSGRFLIVFTAALLRLSASKSNERRKNIMAEKFALTTGASSGIGFSLAKELAGRGYDLAISSSGERLQGASDKRGRRACK